MDSITRFSVWPCCDPQDRTREISRLYDHGRDTGVLVPGLVLEAQMRVGDLWVLFLTHDCPYEEQLDILCLNRALEIVDQAALFYLYSPGIFRVLSSAASRALRFEFNGEGSWVVEFFDRPQPRLPFFSEPFGVWRSFGFRRWFRLSRHRSGAAP